ncbi:uncharacterized protein SPPG_08153 [Spizellomyces punctatus DAOM BR117]|uniref:Fibronectin type-III domain-containing protein n=1 Tax=Spizellomyces punctatus (strain DAOM BR117) TaxID=645134 RepID=A0A0L0H6S3_SPIPD|nr:uncharacterized protein SPPG_08153 [Spizellomyces punctatus DAOM BR117]KNC96566.1 hypothetical protein SPPG_08153 [Spizellomyces punctatus DAOM BR117]|eukprot:XP_016604606.1 hypothetical protein SPPG_08153 [Spizellomyces punctatus DAOM BR117]
MTGGMSTKYDPLEGKNLILLRNRRMYLFLSACAAGLFLFLIVSTMHSSQKAALSKLPLETVKSQGGAMATSDEETRSTSPCSKETRRKEILGSTFSDWENMWVRANDNSIPTVWSDGGAGSGDGTPPEPLETANTDSCWPGWCNFFNPTGKCQCYAECVQKGNCCPDMPQACGMQQPTDFELTLKNVSLSSIVISWSPTACEKFRNTSQFAVEWTTTPEGNATARWLLLHKWECPGETSAPLNVQHVNLAPHKRYHYRMVAQNTSGSYPVSQHVSVVTAPVCAIAPHYNEEVTIPFLVSSLIDHVDYFIILDNGSTDYSLDLVQVLYPQHLQSGRLRIILTGAARGNMGIVRTMGIQLSRNLGCRFMVSLEADSVFYDKGAESITELARKIPSGVRSFRHVWLESMQFGWNTTEQWLDGMTLITQKRNTSVTGDVRRQAAPVSGNYLLRVQGVTAHGAYSDEAAGRGAENYWYGSDRRGENILYETWETWHIHTSLLRPTDRKTEKWKAMGRPPQDAYTWTDPTAVRLKVEELPEAFYRMTDAVRRMYYELQCS